MTHKDARLLYLPHLANVGPVSTRIGVNVSSSRGAGVRRVTGKHKHGTCLYVFGWAVCVSLSLPGTGIKVNSLDSRTSCWYSIAYAFLCTFDSTQRLSYLNFRISIVVAFPYDRHDLLIYTEVRGYVPELSRLRLGTRARYCRYCIGYQREFH